MRTIISAEDITTKAIEDFRNASTEKQRFLVHSGKVSTTCQTVKYETEEKLCYFTEQLRPRFGTKGFVQRKAVAGFTFDKKTKKLKIWYGMKLLKMSESFKIDVFKDLKMEWVSAMGHKLEGLMTRMLLEKIIKGKITNPRDYVKSYVKSHLRVKGVSPELYYKLFKIGSSSTNRGYELIDCTPGHLNEILRYAKNPAWVVQNYGKTNTFSRPSVYNDIIKECKILGRKFDWSWSEARIDEEHTKMSREIRGLEIEFIEDKTVEYKNMPELPEGWEFINNQKRLFLEGSEQDHCVYNYWSQIERKDFFILSVKQEKGKVTASVERSFPWDEPNITVDAQGKPVKGETFRLGQCYGFRNDRCEEELKASPETKQAIRDWLAKPEVQLFLRSQKEEEEEKGAKVTIGRQTIVGNIW